MARGGPPAPRGGGPASTSAGAIPRCDRAAPTRSRSGSCRVGLVALARVAPEVRHARTAQTRAAGGFRGPCAPGPLRRQPRGGSGGQQSPVGKDPRGDPRRGPPVGGAAGQPRPAEREALTPPQRGGGPRPRRGQPVPGLPTSFPHCSNGPSVRHGLASPCDRPNASPTRRGELACRAHRSTAPSAAAHGRRCASRPRGLQRA